MKTRKFVLKASTLAAGLIAALAMAAPPTTRAATPPIIVDDASSATECGSYTTKEAVPDPVDAINNASTGSTIIICPGEYPVTTVITIAGKKLTIKRALTGPGSRPILTVGYLDATSPGALDISDSTVTLDGLILDASANTNTDFRAVKLTTSSATIKNVAIIVSDNYWSTGISSDGADAAKAYPLTISNTSILGYQGFGVHVMGAVRLTLSSSHLDGTDGRSTPSTGIGVYFDGNPAGPLGPSGTVTKSRILNSSNGIIVAETGKVSITNNTLINNGYPLQVSTFGTRSADNNKITGNTILGIASTSEGLRIANNNAAVAILNKFTVSKNVFVAEKYGAGAAGVIIYADQPGTAAISGSVTSNTFIGIPGGVGQSNGPFPGVTVKSNDSVP